MLNSKKSSNSKELSADQGFYYIHVTLYNKLLYCIPISLKQQIAGHEGGCLHLNFFLGEYFEKQCISKYLDLYKNSVPSRSVSYKAVSHEVLL